MCRLGFGLGSILYWPQQIGCRNDTLSVAVAVHTCSKTRCAHPPQDQRSFANEGQGTRKYSRACTRASRGCVLRPHLPQLLVESAGIRMRPVNNECIMVHREPATNGTRLSHTACCASQKFLRRSDAHRARHGSDNVEASKEYLLHNWQCCVGPQVGGAAYFLPEFREVEHSEPIDFVLQA